MTTAIPPMRRLVVTGATGKQGGAVISALLSRPSQPFEIYAVTRNKTSKSAQALASKPNVHVIEGTFQDPNAIFSQVQSPWGLFAMTMPMNAKREEAEGKALTDAATKAGVKHIVFTATERGGQLKSENEPTSIPHFVSKFNIEKHITSTSARNDATWTFLRPVAFFENISNNFVGRAFTAIWRLNGPNNKLQFISTKDIGKIAAEAFLGAETKQFRNQSISLAGDEITLEEARQIFTEVTGQELLETYGFVARILKFILHEPLGTMFDWFKSDGFGVELGDLRKSYPYLKDFRQWLETESAWKK